MYEIIMIQIDMETPEDTSKKGWIWFIVTLLIFAAICAALIFSYKGPL